MIPNAPLRILASKSRISAFLHSSSSGRPSMSWWSLGASSICDTIALASTAKHQSEMKLEL